MEPVQTIPMSLIAALAEHVGIDPNTVGRIDMTADEVTFWIPDLEASGLACTRWVSEQFAIDFSGFPLPDATN